MLLEHASRDVAYALRSIADTDVATRFQCWVGASDRRYTVSVFPFEAG